MDTTTNLGIFTKLTHIICSTELSRYVGLLPAPAEDDMMKVVDEGCSTAESGKGLLFPTSPKITVPK